MTDFDFTGEDLIDRWQINDFELLKWIKKGLQPYNEYGLKIVDPTTEFGRKIMSSFKRKPAFGHVDKKLPESILKSEDETEFRLHLAAVYVSGLLKANNCEADLFDIPANKSKGDALIRRMKKWLFKTNDVFKFEKEHGLYKSSTIFPCDPGTKWEDIKITLTDNETVRVETPKGKGYFTYHKLNMEDKRSGNKPTVVWELLKLFAENQGAISSQNPKYDSQLPETARRLNNHLQKLFGIKDSIYAGHYKKLKGYKTKIFFSDQTNVILPE